MKDFKLIAAKDEGKLSDMQTSLTPAEKSSKKRKRSVGLFSPPVTAEKDSLSATASASLSGARRSSRISLARSGGENVNEEMHCDSADRSPLAVVERASSRRQRKRPDKDPENHDKSTSPSVPVESTAISNENSNSANLEFPNDCDKAASGSIVEELVSSAMETAELSKEEAPSHPIIEGLSSVEAFAQEVPISISESDEQVNRDASSKENSFMRSPIHSTSKARMRRIVKTI